MTPEQLEQARALREAGKTHTEVAKTLGVPRTTLRRQLPDQELIIPAGDNPYDVEPSAVTSLPPFDYSHEQSLVRTALLKAHKSNAPPSVIQGLAKTVADIGKQHIASQVRMSQLLPRTAVLSLAQAMVQVVVDELRGVEGYEAIIDRIVARIYPAINEHQNTKREIEDAIGREH